MSGLGERYWELRWRDTHAENQMLHDEVERLRNERAGEQLWRCMAENMRLQQLIDRYRYAVFHAARHGWGSMCFDWARSGDGKVLTEAEVAELHQQYLVWGGR